jgi:hypothetical protein
VAIPAARSSSDSSTCNSRQLPRPALLANQDVWQLHRLCGFKSVQRCEKCGKLAEEYGDPEPMIHLIDYPFRVFVCAFVVLWISSKIGGSFRKRRKTMDSAESEDFGTIVAATLTLLGLIIGFTFSMAISRYDQRKNYEEAEANAIGTEYVRAGLLPPADAERVRRLLVSYLDQRILFYKTRSAQQLQGINATTAQLQNDLWLAVQTPSAAQPTPIVALAVGGMNDVLNSQGYTQAAWWNRIPIAAWCLMSAIAICCNLLIGYGARGPEAKSLLFLVLPLVVGISFFLIADIDSPRGGVVRVLPQNLTSLAQSLPKQSP